MQHTYGTTERSTILLSGNLAAQLAYIVKNMHHKRNMNKLGTEFLNKACHNLTAD
jgi:hypothetical protein